MLMSLPTFVDICVWRWTDSMTVLTVLVLMWVIETAHNCFDCAKHGLLQKPSYAMFSLCSSIEKVVQLNIESCVNAQHGVVHQLFDLVLSAVDVYSYSLPSVCGSHQLQQTTLWVKKTRHLTLAHNLTKYWPIFKIFSLLDSEGNL